MSFMMDFKGDWFAGGRSATDDRVDRLNRFYAVTFVITCVIFLSTKSLVGKQIYCFTPQHFTDPQVEYATNYCWSKGTYYSVHERDPRQLWTKVWDNNARFGDDKDDDKSDVEKSDDDDAFRILYFDPILWTKDASPAKNGAPVRAKPYRVRAVKDASYYRWFPVVLCAMSFMFYFPHVAWKSLCRSAGINLVEMVSAGHAIASLSLSDDERKTLLSNMGSEFRRITIKEMKRNNRKSNSTGEKNKKNGSNSKKKNVLPPWISKVFFYYMFCKGLYLLNLALQIVLFNSLLRVNVLQYFFSYLYISMYNYEKLPLDKEIFPLLTYCEFPGDPQLHSYLLNFGVVCTLPVNLYNEYVFILVLSAYLVLFVLIVISSGRWLYKVLLCPRTTYLKHRLRWCRPNESFSDSALEALEADFGTDAFFVLRILENNCGAGAAAQILDFMFFWGEDVDEPIHRSVDLT